MSSRGAGADTPSGAYTVVYDGNCSACSRFIHALRRWDKRHLIEILPSQADQVAARFPWIPSSAYSESLQLIRLSDGKTWQGAAAIEQLLDLAPKGRLVSWIFSLPFARAVAEKLYRWFARNRYHFGCDRHCRVVVKKKKWFIR